MVLIIAISQNNPNSLKLSDLQYPVIRDAPKYKNFVMQYLGVKEEDITVLKDEAATVDEIEYAISKMYGKAMDWNKGINTDKKTDEKILITVFASCHGYMNCTSHIFLPNGYPEGNQN